MNEAELVLTELFSCDRVSLYLNKSQKLGAIKSRSLSGILKRRISGEPIQYILKKTEFMGLEFSLSEHVLIPRPETEILVETAMRYASSAMRPESCVKILDIGTGSGCIAVSLAKLLANVKITATDISLDALEIAKLNAKSNNVSGKINFYQADLFLYLAKRTSQNAPRKTRYDVIVSNPPYVNKSDIGLLAPEVRSEPVIALDGGVDGLDFYRRIASEAPAYLKKNAFIVVEVGYKQAGRVKKIFESTGKLSVVQTVRDYNNIERVLVIKNG